MRTTCALFLAAAMTSTATAAPSDVILNELTTWSPQTVEILNTSPVIEDITGFKIIVGGDVTPTPQNAILPGQFLIIQLPNEPMDLNGDAVGWFDDLNQPIDVVLYGDEGGAPAPVAQPFFSLARTGGGANDDLADNWTVSFFSTLGAPNNTFSPLLDGSGIVMNEWLLFETNIIVELYNQSGVTVPLGGYRLTNDFGSIILPPTAFLPPFGFLAVNAFDLRLSGSHPNVYLFRDDGVRLDQVGFADAPDDSTSVVSVRALGNSFCRVPDGAPPYDGFDLPSSGWPFRLTRCDPTPGGPNGTATSVDPAVQQSTWGRVKRLFHR